ncbi:MAG: DUF1858 domain-containing protein [Clostridia bacterium]|nr:DUF1858 domain-containing protein [Clostridia bacterium]
MITKDTLIVDAIRIKKETIPVFGAFGLGCVHCLAANTETIEQAAMTHGLDLDEFLDALNKA